MACRSCGGQTLNLSDEEVGGAIGRGVCECWTTGRCTVCVQGPVVQEVYDAGHDDRDDPDMRCRAHRHVDIAEDIVFQPRTIAPEAPMLEHLVFELRRDPRTYLCNGCGKNYKSKDTKVIRGQRGWQLCCPRCESTECTVKPAEMQKHKDLGSEIVHRDPPYWPVQRGIIAVPASVTSLRKRLVRRSSRAVREDFTE
jgi:hypothetical protein